VCAPGGPPSPAIPNPRIGCLPPAGMCYLPGPLFNGVADGVCVAALDQGEPGPFNCGVCNPSLNPWARSPLPDGLPCDDDRSCTSADSCSGGICSGVCDDSLPGCVGLCEVD